MTRKMIITLLLALMLVVPFDLSALVKSRYVTLQYSSVEVLREFNSNLVFGRKLRYYVQKRTSVTLEDEILAKLDVLIEKVEVVLDMFPNNLHITVVVLPTKKEVAAIYRKKYGKRANHIAYYSLTENTIYISADDAKVRVIAHEIGHAIVDHYFQVRPPYNIHELMAQFAEKHFDD